MDLSDWLELIMPQSSMHLDLIYNDTQTYKSHIAMNALSTWGSQMALLNSEAIGSKWEHVCTQWWELLLVSWDINSYPDSGGAKSWVKSSLRDYHSARITQEGWGSCWKAPTVSQCYASTTSFSQAYTKACDADSSPTPPPQTQSSEQTSVSSGNWVWQGNYCAKPGYDSVQCCVFHDAS